MNTLVDANRIHISLILIVFTNIRVVKTFELGATQFFLTQIKTHSYGPVTIVGEGAFSCIIPQGNLEIILLNFLGGTVYPLENVNLFGVLDPVEQPAKFKCLKVNRQQ